MLNFTFPLLGQEPIELELNSLIPDYKRNADFSTLQFRYGREFLIIDNMKRGVRSVKLLPDYHAKKVASCLDKNKYLVGTCDQETAAELSKYYFDNLK